MYFDRDKIKRNAKMVRIGLSDAEADRMIPEMESILEWISNLDGADAGGVEPLITTADFPLPLHPDRVVAEGSRGGACRRAGRL